MGGAEPPQRGGRLDYRAAGVDIDAGDAVVDAISAAALRTHGPRVLRGLGHFGGFYRIGPAGDQATLVASTDSVGTKLKVAIAAGRHSGIGYDLVHHCINDIIACGATPLFFLDYYASGRLRPEHATEIVTSIARACEEQQVALVGGETAELPGVYAGEDYDVVGFIVGVVDATTIIDGRAVREDDVVFGLPSDGFHTNGYSLVRAALGLNEDDGEASRHLLDGQVPGDRSGSLGDLLLRPHRCYAREVRELLTTGNVHGMAHITGGGIPGNVTRIIPSGLCAEIDTRSWEVPAAMRYVIQAGGIALEEAYRAFNMGIGFVVVMDPVGAEAAMRSVKDLRIIGRVTTADAEGRVRLVRQA